MKAFRRHSPLALIVAAALVLVVAACGDGETSTTETSVVTTSSVVPTSSTTTTPPSTTATTATTTPTTTTSTTAATTTTTTTTAAPTTTTLPGDPIDVPPWRGDIVGVVGVAHDDVLNVRAGPGTDQAIVATLDPLEDDVLVLGNARSLPNSIWTQVENDGVAGWVNIRFLAYLGDTDDITARLVNDLGATPTAETMLDLGLIVAEALAAIEPPSRIVMSVAPTVGDLGEVTYDVIGLGDDSLHGVRLHVFGMPDEGGEGFVLKTVERTQLCARGVSDGFCV
jgi:hypothetical protein